MSLADNYRVNVYPVGRGSWMCDILENYIVGLGITRWKPISEDLFKVVQKKAFEQGSNADVFTFFNPRTRYPVTASFTPNNVVLLDAIPALTSLLRYLKGVEGATQPNPGVDDLQIVFIEELEDGTRLTRKITKEDTRFYKLQDIIDQLQAVYDQLVTP